MHGTNSRNGFALIELIVALSVLVVLVGITIFSIDPIEYIRQARDTTRISDLTIINLALAEYKNLYGEASMGAISTVYVSIPDPTATSSIGTSCEGLGLPEIPPDWKYHCAHPAYYRNIIGTGWIPINFAGIPLFSSFGAIPIDPVNQTSSEKYYTYARGNSWELTTIFESKKKASIAASDGGPDPAMYETGTSLTVTPFAHSMVGYWSMNELSNASPSAATHKDSSGWKNDASMNTSAPNPITGGVQGKIGKAVRFENTDPFQTEVQKPWSFGLNFTMLAWSKIQSNDYMPLVSNFDNIGNGGLYIGENSNSFLVEGSLCDQYSTPEYHEIIVPKKSPGSSFNLYALTGDLLKSKSVKVFDNGTRAGIYKVNCPGTPNPPSTQLLIGSGKFARNDAVGANVKLNYVGTLDEIRLYRRTLSENVIKAYYEAIVSGE